jgi:hypothetical protein
MSQTPATGNLKQFADYLGVHKSSVTRANQAGRLIKAANGQIDFAASAARWHDTKGARADVAARHAENRGQAIPTPQPAAQNGPAARNTAAEASLAQPDATTPGGQGRTRYKAAVLHYENASIKLGMALQRGLRYPLASVKRESLGLGQTVRAAVERIIDQTAPRLAVMTHELDRRRLINAELRRLRWMIKSELPRSLRRMRAEGGKGGSAQA